MWVNSQSEKKDVLTVDQCEKVSQDADRPSHFCATICRAGRVSVEAPWTLPCSARLSLRDIPGSARSQLGHPELFHPRVMRSLPGVSSAQGPVVGLVQVNGAEHRRFCATHVCVIRPVQLCPAAGLVQVHVKQHWFSSSAFTKL